MSYLGGTKVSRKIRQTRIENLQDLLLYFPFRYRDFKTKQGAGATETEKGCSVWSVVTPARVIQYYGSKRNRLRF